MRETETQEEQKVRKRKSTNGSFAKINGIEKTPIDATIKKAMTNFDILCILEDGYGKPKKEYIQAIQDREKGKAADDSLMQAESIIAHPRNMHLLDVDFPRLLEALFIYAYQKPCDLSKLNRAKKAVGLFFAFDEGAEPTANLAADLIAAANLGKEALRAKEGAVHAFLQRENKDGNAHGLNREVCSLLCMLGAYEQELSALNLIFSNSWDMDTDMQQRMTFLQKGGAQAKSVYRTDAKAITNGLIPVELASSKWSANDMKALFSQIAMSGAPKLTYALAIRGSNKSIPLTDAQNAALGKVAISKSAMCQAIRQATGLPCSVQTLEPLDGQQRLNGFVVTTQGLGLATIMNRAGRQVTLNQLTFFYPTGLSAAEQQNTAQALLAGASAQEKTLITAMQTAIQTYLQREMDKIQYGGGTKPAPAPAPTPQPHAHTRAEARPPRRLGRPLLTAHGYYQSDPFLPRPSAKQGNDRDL